MKFATSGNHPPFLTSGGWFCFVQIILRVVDKIVRRRYLSYMDPEKREVYEALLAVNEEALSDLEREVASKEATIRVIKIRLARLRDLLEN